MGGSVAEGTDEDDGEGEDHEEEQGGGGGVFSVGKVTRTVLRRG